MGQTVTQGTAGHNQPWLSYSPLKPPRIGRPCPFSVLLCKFEVGEARFSCQTRRNVGETQRKSGERVGRDGIRIADPSPVSPIIHPGTVCGDAPRLASRQSRFALNLIC